MKIATKLKHNQTLLNTLRKSYNFPERLNLVDMVDCIHFQVQSHWFVSDNPTIEEINLLYGGEFWHFELGKKNLPIIVFDETALNH